MIGGGFMVREILLWPDQRLKRPVELETAFDASLAKLAQELKATCAANNGAGLAAPQIGDARRVIVVLDDVFVNPVIDEGYELALHSEGCLSFPGASAAVERFTEIILTYNDVDGKQYTKNISGFQAHVIQHEVDHLSGVVIPDHLDSFHRERFLKRVKAAKRRVV